MPKPTATAGRESRRRPRIRLRLRTVLVLVCLIVLALPVAGLQVLRIYESVLLRQTESNLIGQAAWLTASFRAALAAASGELPTDYGTPRREPVLVPSGPVLDFADAEVLPPLPETRLAATPVPWTARIGATLQSVLDDAQATSRTAVRVVDAAGAVIATTEDDLGASLHHIDEVGMALAGHGDSRLRGIAGNAPGMAWLSRGTAVEVFVSRPVVIGERIAGAVLLARKPPTIVETLYRQRALLLQGATVVFGVVVAIALVAARALVLPIQRLSRGAGRLSRGETRRFERGRPYRVLEIAELADSVETMAAKLQQRSAYVRSLARHVSHEFKTPIAAVRGAVELLRDHLADMTAAERERFLDNVAADIERLDHLTLRLLELANVDMAEASDEVTDVLAAARAIGHDMLHVGSGEATARIAATSITAVLRNLMDNAKQHGASRVDVCAARNGGEVDIRVADNGTGISAGNRARVFEPFFTTRRERGGTGLGLAITQSLVQQAGGSIELAPSETGAAFRIVLPAGPEDP